MLAAQARLQPSRVGARDLERELTFSAWNTRANQLANALIGLGIGKGERIAIFAFNRLEWAEIYCAVAKAGIVAVPINFRLTPPEALFICRDCAVSAVIAGSDLVGTVNTIRPDLGLPPERFILMHDSPAPGWRSYEEVLIAGAKIEPDVPITPEDPWCLMYTSGTTGNPKGAIRSHRGMAMLALMTQVELGLARRDDALLVMPMCHANSLNFFTSFLAIGAAVTIFSRQSFDPELCLKTIGEIGVTFSSMVPTHYMMMLDAPNRHASGFKRVEKLMVSSAPARIETKRAIMEMFPRSQLFELYGSTEAGWVTLLHPDELFDHLGTVGREVTGSAPVRILDDDGNEVPDGAVGELFSCSPYAFEGYWNLPEKTAEAFRGDYLTVGDMALRDEHGFIKLIDRKKNLIITGGENVYPAEVESVLSQHDAVRDVAVVGIEDARWGERVAAAVVLRPGADVSADNLLSWARDRLAGHKRPRQIVFLDQDEMPRNTTGKILHRVLREMLKDQVTNTTETPT
ncbi:class I adenylate-forming enzyme family protein [Litoreibacter ponti]|nr:AMP-binding protein [Litoreibacter ponti]